MALTATISSARSVVFLFNLYKKIAITGRAKDFDVYYTAIAGMNIFACVALWRNFYVLMVLQEEVVCHQSVIIFIYALTGVVHLQIAINWLEVASKWIYLISKLNFISSELVLSVGTLKQKQEYLCEE